MCRLVMGVLVNLLSASTGVYGYSAGAPESACADGLPDHNGAQPQTSTSPFEVVLQGLSNDQVVHITRSTVY